MNFLKTGLSVAVVGAGLTLVPLTSPAAVSAPARAADDPSLEQQMRRTADGAVRTTDDAATGRLGFVAARGADADLLPDVAASNGAAAARKATAYLDRFGAAFGAGKGQLEQTDMVRDRYGWVVTFEQQYRGVPVFGGTLKASLDRAGDLNAVSGFAAPGLDLAVQPRVTATEAAARAASVVRADPPTGDDGDAADTSGLRGLTPELVVYQLGSLKGEAGEAVLAYTVEVTNGRDVRDVVILDAQTNKPVNRYSTVADALDRELYETSPDTDPVWTEGDPLPGSLNEDQQNLVNSAGESYWMFFNSFARDSYDGGGSTMKTVNNDPRISCPNANWNGVTTNYCDGVTSDDVVSHEWGHAYTEFTSGLIYQFQSGALNESYSDVWGETLDLINGREDEGETFTETRADGDCDATAPPALEFEITAPTSAAGPCFAVAATGAKPFTTTEVTAEVIVATDAADATGPSTTDGCTAFTNAADVADDWAYVDRGTCPFAAKVANAKTAGATGIVVGNNNIDPPGGFTGDAALYGAMVTQADGTRIKTAGTVSVAVTAEDVSSRADTTRWLVGEKSTAFGGAIRDMWSPTCYGDPGKVSDAEYKCDPLNTDAGGVHSNSGIPNKAYALVVDGGTANDVEVTGLGIDKAAAIWWRAQSTYLTPSSDFGDAADAWEQSCTDLVDQEINVVTTEPDAEPTVAEPIVAGDCASVTAAIAATEMRSGSPTRCNFQPLLESGSPSPCGEGFTTSTVWSEKFEDGLAGWERDQEIAPTGGFGAPWRGTESAPARTGGVAYGPTPDRGSCSGDGVDDFSSRDSIISPVITTPDQLRAPVLSFDHNVATEAGFDGGNVKVSVNEGRFDVVPAEAYLFNPNNTELTSLAGGNTSPLAGEEGFSGTDGGEVTGSWGTSLVDLSALGVKPGDEVRIRFDIGRDGCGGIDGWYVDNVIVTACEKGDAVGRSTTTASAPAAARSGRDFAVRAKVATADGEPAAGRVQVLYRGDKLGQGRLDDRGRVSVEVTRNLKPGKVTLRVLYLGNPSTKPSRDSVTVRIFREG